ncbi:MAG: hypothetical protein H8E66_23640 [Planctomycetes bacterium]|nr:hypothetical protein [Planctomycetota bacterium]
MVDLATCVDYIRQDSELPQLADIAKTLPSSEECMNSGGCLLLATEFMLKSPRHVLFPINQ